MAVAGVRADTLGGVARRIYQQEADGGVGHAAVRRIARDRALLAALRSGNSTALRTAALRQLFNPGKHVVRLTSSATGTRCPTSAAPSSSRRRGWRCAAATRSKPRCRTSSAT